MYIYYHQLKENILFSNYCKKSCFFLFYGYQIEVDKKQISYRLCQLLCVFLTNAQVTIEETK